MSDFSLGKSAVNLSNSLDIGTPGNLAMLRVLPTDISLPGTLRTYARLKSTYLDETEVGLYFEMGVRAWIGTGQKTVR